MEIKASLPPFLLGNVEGTPVYVKCGQDTNAHIQKIIDANLLKYDMPGIQMSIWCPGEDAPRNFVSGFTTLEKNVALKSTHLFQVGSETKSFITVIILQLEAEGLLSINDPISNYLSNLPQSWQNVTIKQLLNHSSGISNYTDVLEYRLKHDDNFVLNMNWSSEDLVDMVSNKPMYFEPGTDFHYSNTNYVLAGIIIENISEHSLAYEIRVRLLDSLQLSSTYYLPFNYGDEVMQLMAHGYSKRGIFADEPKDITSTNHSWENAAGAMVSTTSDMARWFKSLVQGSLLHPRQMQELMTFIPGKLPNSSDTIEYGLGIIHDYNTFGEETLWHSGGTLGYRALMLWLKSKNIIITANVNHFSQDKDVYNLCQDISDYFSRSNVL